jgi:uncharacterized protein (TIGR00369 family)
MNDAPDNFILRLMRGEVPQHTIGATLGARIELLDLDGGRLEMTFVGTDAFCNPAGHVQGGMLAAMLDDVTASLATATGTRDERCATLDLHTSFLRPAKVGEIRAVARVVRRGREIVNVSGELSQEGRLVATAVATCMLVGSAR